MFGHSYGGLAVLHTAAQADVFDRIAVYEPGVSIGGSIPTHWMPRYRQFLDHGDTRGAFAYFVQQSGHAPAPVKRLPLWYLRLALRLVVRKAQWARFEPLLAANLLEHRQLAACDGAVGHYQAIKAEALILDGSRSPSLSALEPLTTLRGIIPRSEVTIMAGLDHNAPDEKAPAAVAERLLRFFTRSPGGQQ